MKYPITPEYIRNAPNELVRLYEQLEAFILTDICERFRASETAQNTALEQIRELQRRGYSLKDIESYIKHTLKLSDEEYTRIINGALEANNAYYTDVADMMGATFDAEAMAAEVDAIIRQTKGNLDNLTQSMGFAIRRNGQVTYMPIAQAYQQVLSDAEIKVWSGTQDYNSAIRQAVKELTNSGIRVVDYDKDGHEHHDHVDVAARRAVMTGITQLSAQYSEEAMRQLPTDLVEVTAHVGARDTNGKKPWDNHKEWQGKVYRRRN